MSDEKVNILDEYGHPTGRSVDRSDAHRDQLWHEVAHVWILNQENKLLLQKRSALKKQYSDVWHISCAGHIAFGESPINTAAREVYEEIGIKVVLSDFEFLGRFKVSQIIPETGLNDREFINLYFVKIKSSNLKINLQETEVKETKWISLEDFKNEIEGTKTYKKYLNHPKSYYLNTLLLIKSLQENK